MGSGVRNQKKTETFNALLFGVHRRAEGAKCAGGLRRSSIGERRVFTHPVWRLKPSHCGE